MMFTIHWTMVAFLIGLGWMLGFISLYAYCRWVDRCLTLGWEEDADPLRDNWQGK